MESTTHLLGKYRGFGLFYEEDEDVFYSDLQSRFELRGNREPKRKSLRDLKKVIDETIKLNLKFQPFEAYMASIGWDAERGKEPRIAHDVPVGVKIIGIRKDGVILLEKKNNHSTTQLHGGDRLKLFIKDKTSEKIGGEIAIIEAEITNLREKKEKLLAKYKPLDLTFVEDFVK